jgi:hypothetical protein
MKENNNPHNLAADVLYFICAAVNDKAVVYDTRLAWFENKYNKFAVHWPTARIIYTNLHEQWNSISAVMTSITVVEMQCEGLLDSGKKTSWEEGVDPNQQWKAQLQHLNSSQKSELKKFLYNPTIQRPQAQAW